MTMIPRMSGDALETAWLDGASDVRRVRMTITPGSLWLFRGFRLPDGPNGAERWHVHPGLYRVVGVAKHVRTRTDLVVHVGVGGPDDGLLYACPLASWADHFAPQAQTAPEKTVELRLTRQQLAAKAALWAVSGKWPDDSLVESASEAVAAPEKAVGVIS